MTASIDIVRREHKDVWKVPAKALNFKPDDGYLTAAITARLDEWKLRPDSGDWVTVWTWNETNHSMWPMFLRILGNGGGGESGLKDSEGNEVLEWEGTPPSVAPRLIIKAPPARRPGIFEGSGGLKVS
jgi:hypothetical protein